MIADSASIVRVNAIDSKARSGWPTSTDGPVLLRVAEQPSHTDGNHASEIDRMTPDASHIARSRRSPFAEMPSTPKTLRTVCFTSY